MALPISTASLFNTSPTGIDRDALVQLLNQLINPETAASAFTNVDNHFSTPQTIPAATTPNQAVTLGQLPVTTPAASAAVTVGASPFAYTAPSAGSVCVSGGAITSVTLARGGVTVYTSGLAADQVVVRAGDVVTVTYTTAPTMYFLGN